MGAHSTHDKVLIRILSLKDNFFLDGRGQLAGILCFQTELSWSYNQKQTYGVLQTGSVLELFYEWTTTKKMKDPWSS